MESLGAELTQFKVSVSRLLGHRGIFALLLSLTFQGCSKPKPVIEAQKPQGSSDDHTTLPQSTPEEKNINSLPEGTLPEFKKNFFLKEHDLELIWIDRGSFQMGSEHPNAPENEKPLTLSTLSRGYWLAKLETRQDLYAKLTEENPSLTQGAKLPVENLTYLDAVSFCEKLTHYEAEMGRLPKNISTSFQRKPNGSLQQKVGAIASQKMAYPRRVRLAQRQQWSIRSSYRIKICNCSRTS